MMQMITVNGTSVKLITKSMEVLQGLLAGVKSGSINLKFLWIHIMAVTNMAL